MRTVWKFGPVGFGLHEIEMPDGALVLTAQMQHRSPYLWAMVNPNRPKVRRTFLMMGTGHESTYTGPLAYIGTVQEDGGALIWHVFECTEAASAS